MAEEWIESLVSNEFFLSLRIGRAINLEQWEGLRSSLRAAVPILVERGSMPLVVFEFLYTGMQYLQEVMKRPDLYDTDELHLLTEIWLEADRMLLELAARERGDEPWRHPDE